METSVATGTGGDEGASGDEGAGGAVGTDGDLGADGAARSGRAVERVDVVVVGGGPTGLTLAGELARRGASVVVLEKRPAVSDLSRAFGVHARTLELLDQRGLAEDLMATGTAAPGLNLLGSARIDLSALDSPFNCILVTPQCHVDRALERWAVGCGARVLRRAEVVSVDQDGDGVTVVATTPDGGTTFRAAWAVGADGTRSPVRRALGAGFPGRSLLSSIVLVDVVLDDPPPDVVTVDAVGDCFAFVAPFGDGLYRVICWDRLDQGGEDEPLRADDVRDVLRRAMGTDYGMREPRWMSRFSCDERQVATYRAGRVLLAGDAAHMHSPAGGQGMNTGIQDAVNLGWKLAAVLDGADEAVLDSYDAERHPVGALVVRTSGAIIRLMLVRSTLGRALRTLLLSRALRFRPIAAKAAGTFSAVGISYGRRPGQHAMVGRRAGDLPLASDPGATTGAAPGAGSPRGDGAESLPSDGEGPSRLFEALRAGTFVLVLEPGAPDAPAHRGVVVVRRADPGPGMLVRPDGHVAWAGDTATGAWRDTLHEWLPPAAAPGAERAGTLQPAA